MPASARRRLWLLPHFPACRHDGEDLRRAIVELNRDPDGLQGLVLDLRDNPGGVLEAAVEVADSFLEQGLIVTASGRTRDATFRHEALPGDLLAGAPLVVLVNGGSASASEIVAGALKEHHRATIAGRVPSAGSVQTVMPLSEGRAIADDVPLFHAVRCLDPGARHCA
jgi:carboxyl-terminal processing protease